MKILKKFVLLLCLGTAFAGFVACGSPNATISTVSSTSPSSSDIESTSDPISDSTIESTSESESSSVSFSGSEDSSLLASSSDIESTSAPISDSTIESTSESESSSVSFSGSEDSSLLASSSEEVSSTVLDSSNEENSSNLDSAFDDSSLEKDSSLSAPADSSSSAPKSYDLDGAINYLKTEYENFYNYTRSDYYLVNKAVYLENEYTVIWSVDVDCITVNEQESNYWIDVDESTLEDVPYVLTAKVVAPDDTYKEFSFERTLQGIRSASSAVELDLKELRTNIDDYVGQRVGFEATVTTYSDWTIYVEDYDETTQMNYGMVIFYGYNFSFHSLLAPGNRVRIVGNLSYSENYGYQISSLKYDPFDPYNPDNILKLGEGYEGAYQEIALDKFYSQMEIGEKTFTWADLALDATVSLKNLKVVNAYTTNNGGANDGAISLTCEAEDKTITVRVAPLKDEDGNLILHQNDLLNKTIDAKGIVASYNKEFQIKVFLLENIYIHPSEKTYDLNAAVNYLFSFYKDRNSSRESYSVLKAFEFDNTIYTVTWETDVDFIQIIENENSYSINLENAPEYAVVYTLTFTVTAPDGSSKTKNIAYTLEAIPLIPLPIDEAPIENTMYKLYMHQVLQNTDLYFTGKMSDYYYFGTTNAKHGEDYTNGIDISVKKVEGKDSFYLTFIDPTDHSTIQYIGIQNVYQSNKWRFQPIFSSSPVITNGGGTFEFTYSPQYGTIIATIDDAKSGDDPYALGMSESFFLGSYSIYNTISVLNVSEINNEDTSIAYLALMHLPSEVPCEYIIPEPPYCLKYDS